MKAGAGYQCSRCGMTVYSKKAADKHWNETCPKLNVKKVVPVGKN